MKKGNPGIAMKLYRIERWLYTHHMKFPAKIVSRFLQVLCGCIIPPTTQIGEDTIIPHSIGIVLHQTTVIGKRCIIYQNVTLGNDNGPKILDDVIIGTGAVILGDITIGNGVKIGANCVVLNDIPDNCTVVGVPGRIVKKD